jgi:predicted NBD/HSP70 family sugar kinase
VNSLLRYAELREKLQMTAIQESFEFEDSDIRFARALLRHGMRNAREWRDTEFRGLSQTAIAADIHLSRPTVSAQVARASQLLADNRSGLLLDPSKCGYVIGIDFGQAHNRITLADVHGRLHETKRPEVYETVGSELPATISFAWAAERVHMLLDEANLDPSRVWAVGVSLPGPVNKRTKRLQNVPGKMDQSWEVVDVYLPGDLNLPKPIVESDYNASALTEHIWGATRDRRHALYVKVSQRCACSLLINHRIYRGSDGMAGRLGKTWIEELADPWVDVETIFSLPGLEKLGYACESAEALVGEAKDNFELSEALKQGAHGLGIALAPVIDAFNPEAVVIGGALGKASFAWVAKQLIAGINRLGHSPARATISERLSAATFSRETAIRGAIASALLADGPARIAEAMAK